MFLRFEMVFRLILFVMAGVLQAASKPTCAVIGIRHLTCL